MKCRLNGCRRSISLSLKPSDIFISIYGLMPLLLIVNTYSFDPFSTDIPADEFEAELMMKNNEIDSIIWLQLKPFYHNPLKVPQGELVLLHDIFPETRFFLPADETILSRYIPWNDDAINRFKSDFPMVQRFTSIIHFEYTNQRKSGTASFCLHYKENNAIATNSARFALWYKKEIRSSCSLDFTDSYARWDRRYFSITPAALLEINAGNYHFITDKGLLYGFFPDDTTSTDIQKNNWLYSSSQTWNGIALDLLSPGKKQEHTPVARVFIHKRPTEFIYGSGATVPLSNYFTLFSALTHLMITNETSGRYCIHSALCYKSKNTVTEITYVSDNIQFPKNGLLFESNLNRNDYHSTITVLHFSPNFSTPRSALSRKLKHEMEIDDSLSPAITFMRITPYCQKNKATIIYPQINLWMNGKNFNRCCLSIRGSKKIDPVKIEAEFNHSFRTEDIFSDYKTGVNVYWNVVPRFSIATTGHVYHSYKNGSTFRGTIGPLIQLLVNSTIEPGLKGTFRNGSLHSLSTEYRQKTIIHEKSFTEFLLEKEFSPSDKRRVFRAQGTISFTF